MAQNYSEAKMEFRLQEFMQNLERIRAGMGRNAKTFVQTQSRRLIKKWAWLAPIKTGRLRAGFWPAALSLQMTNIYTRHPNIGEGVGINNLNNENHPSVTIGNHVPYVGFAGKHGTAWWYKGIKQVEARAEKELEKVVTGAWAYGERKK